MNWLLKPFLVAFSKSRFKRSKKRKKRKFGKNFRNFTSLPPYLVIRTFLGVSVVRKVVDLDARSNLT